MRYSFNIPKLIDMLVAYTVRKPAHIAWLRSGLKPLSSTYTEFMAFVTAKQKESTINSSVNRFTKALNDRFDSSGIYIIHALDYLDSAYEFLALDAHYPEFDYLASEKHIPVDFDYLNNEFNPDYDFVVRVPANLTLKQEEIKAFVAKYTMAGRRFKIDLY